MTGRHHFQFHEDHYGHSITVHVHTGPGGLGGSVELLVDGKEVGNRHLGAHGARLLSGELPEDPPRAVRVLVQRPRRGGAPLCTLDMDGAAHPMPERAVA